MTILDNMVGKTVRIFPLDTHKKTAILKEVNEFGFIFQITHSEEREFPSGKIIFYPHSKAPSFFEV